MLQGVLQAVDKMTATGVGAHWMVTLLAIVLAVAIATLSSLLAKVAFSKTAGEGFYSAARLRFAAIGGLAATIVGGAVAFVPPRQVESVWRFELKMVGNCTVFMGIAALLFWDYSRRRAA